MSNGQAPASVHAALAKFEESRANLDAFVTQNQDVINEYLDLVKNHEDCESALKRQIKDNRKVIGNSFGPFRVQVTVGINVRKLIELMEDKAEPYFVVEYALKRKEYLEACRSGDIPPEVIKEVEFDDKVSLVKR